MNPRMDHEVPDEMLTLHATNRELNEILALVNERIDFLSNSACLAVLHQDWDRALLLARERNHLIENVRANLNRTIDPR